MSSIQGYPGHHKNDTGVIVNKSQSERRAYRQMKAQAAQQLESQDEIKTLKAELDELKDLVKQLITK